MFCFCCTDLLMNIVLFLLYWFIDNCCIVFVVIDVMWLNTVLFKSKILSLTSFPLQGMIKHHLEHGDELVICNQPGPWLVVVGYLSRWGWGEVELAGRWTAPWPESGVGVCGSGDMIKHWLWADKLHQQIAVVLSL